jgi:hypothetical protein
MEPEKFVKDITRIHKILPYIDVRREGVFRYTVSNPGVWTAHVDGNLDMRVGDNLVIRDRILLNDKEAELRLSAGGIKIRIGAVILAFYSWLDMLPISVTRKKMLYYVNNVEKNPEVAEFAIWALVARSALDEAVEIAMAATNEIWKMRLAAHTARV